MDVSPIQVGEVWIEETKRFDVPHTAIHIKQDRDGRWLVKFDDAGPLPIYWDAEGCAKRWTKKG